MYRTLFGLIAAAGLRLSEALKLRVGDVDLHGATITVRQTKFHKSRCLPHPRQRGPGADASTAACATGTPMPMPSAPFFVSRTGGFLPARHGGERLRAHAISSWAGARAATTPTRASTT